MWPPPEYSTVGRMGERSERVEESGHELFLEALWRVILVGEDPGEHSAVIGGARVVGVLGELAQGEVETSDALPVEEAQSEVAGG